ncbi:enoyl-CoA hydratase/isomerase family protein [Cryptosporangium sp. NPDC051539]|uniref:enoyl-CoA hydratase/isomerase family protein n=1 Tax=Cryptosporangium sp. NPDC051539 TaxID=3363962 RepID=UPI0037A1C278
MTDVVLVQPGPVSVVRINRPEAHNALNDEVLTGVRDAVRAAALDPRTRAVVLTGSGQKAFSAGADLKQLSDLSVDRAVDLMRAGQEALRQIETAGIPVVAAVNGIALGGGLELVLAATIPVLSARASLGLPEAGLGLIPGYGGTQRLPRAIGRAAAAHLMLTGERLDADRAYALGLTPVPPVAPDDLMDTAVSIARTIADRGPRAVRAILEALETGRDAPLDAGLRAESALAVLAISGAEAAEGIAAFLDRRPARFADAGPQA